MIWASFFYGLLLKFYQIYLVNKIAAYIFYYRKINLIYLAIVYRFLPEIIFQQSRFKSTYFYKTHNGYFRRCKRIIAIIVMRLIFLALFFKIINSYCWGFDICQKGTWINTNITTVFYTIFWIMNKASQYSNTNRFLIILS
jgi:hypothetical protein